LWCWRESTTEDVNTVIGRVFDDRYEVIRKLGSGGMAEVFVALKVLFDRYANDEQFVERFRREASSAAGLNHPNIVQIYDRGQAENTYYIAMEYLEGRSLKEIILRYAPLNTDLVLSISTQIVEALRFAHRRDVIHRDIKPQNIIVDNEGRVKVTDFGIARAGSASTMTEAGSILGTAHYLSPEQAKGQPVEAASDLYSLGVVMYEMATGKLPFSGDNPVGIAMQHVHDAPAPPRSIVPEVPENLEAVILRALAKHPVERYLTAQAMLDDLARVQDGEPVSLPASYMAEATRVMSPAAAAAAAAMSSGMQPTMIRHRLTDELEAVTDNYEEPRRPSVWPWVLVIVLILALAGAAYAIFSNWGGTSDELAVVPAVLNLSEAEAKQKIEGAGFEFDPQNQASATVEVGLVVRQNPEEGNKLAKGEKVTVYISTGKGKVEVPNLAGKSRDTASNELGKLGLGVNPQTEATDDEKMIGVVIRQSPEAGQMLEVGGEVTIIVGVAGETIAVPRVIGMNQAAAESYLSQMNLVAKVEPITSTSPGGTVVDQTPKENEKVQKGTTVTIYVSNAPAVTTVKVPAVGGIGLTVAEAKAKLQLYNLTWKITPYYVDTPAPGIVLGQDPVAGQEVQKGSTVELFVSETPPTTTTTEPPTTTTILPPSTDTTFTTDF
jgi:beta-lactam-binding protein with PASTA domain/predicted Ser/Thr protein kinase